MRKDILTWSSGSAATIIENWGIDGRGKLTWDMLADTMLGVGTFLQQQTCTSGQWIIMVDGIGSIGVGFVGAKEIGDVRVDEAGIA